MSKSLNVLVAFVAALLLVGADDPLESSGVHKIKPVLCPAIACPAIVECPVGYFAPCGCCSTNCCEPEKQIQPCPDCFVECEEGSHAPCGCCTKDCCVPNRIPKLCLTTCSTIVECPVGYYAPCGCCSTKCCKPEKQIQPCPDCLVECDEGSYAPCGCCTKDCCVPKPKPKPCEKGCYKQYQGKKYTCNCCHKYGGLTHPCAAALCGPNTTCEAVVSKCEDNLGIGCDFKPQAKCRAICPEGNNSLRCKKGQYLVYDINGCKTCYNEEGFVNPCNNRNAICKANETCVLQQVTCKKAPCYPVPECRKTNCPRYPVGFPKGCPKNCLEFIGPDGCKGCMCCNGCVNHTCPKGEECTLETMFCIRAPCPPRVTCRKPS